MGNATSSRFGKSATNIGCWRKKDCSCLTRKNRAHRGRQPQPAQQFFCANRLAFSILPRKRWHRMVGGGEHGLWQIDPDFGFAPLVPDAPESVYNRFGRALDAVGTERRFVTEIYAGKLWVFEHGKCLKIIQLPGFAGILHEDKHGKIWDRATIKFFRWDKQTFFRGFAPFPVPEHLTGCADLRFFRHGRRRGGQSLVCEQPRRPADLPNRHPNLAKTGRTGGFHLKKPQLPAGRPGASLGIGTEDLGCSDSTSRRARSNCTAPTRPRPGSLGAYIVFSLCRDGQGKIWAATDPGGIFQGSITTRRRAKNSSR